MATAGKWPTALTFLLERLPAVAAGGLCIDRSAGWAANLTHLLLWCVLALFPWVLGLLVPAGMAREVAAAVYASSVAGIFIAIKCTCFVLHKLLDRAALAAHPGAHAAPKGTKPLSPPSRVLPPSSASSRMAPQSPRKRPVAAAAAAAVPISSNYSPPPSSTSSAVSLPSFTTLPDSATPASRKQSPERSVAPATTEAVAAVEGATSTTVPQTGSTAAVVGPRVSEDLTQAKPLEQAERERLLKKGTSADSQPSTAVSSTSDEPQRLATAGVPRRSKLHEMTTVVSTSASATAIPATTATTTAAESEGNGSSDSAMASSTILLPDEEVARQISAEQTFEQGREDYDAIHTFIDENGEVQYYSFVAPSTRGSIAGQQQQQQQQQSHRRSHHKHQPQKQQTRSESLSDIPNPRKDRPHPVRHDSNPAIEYGTLSRGKEHMQEPPENTVSSERATESTAAAAASTSAASTSRRHLPPSESQPICSQQQRGSSNDGVNGGSVGEMAVFLKIPCLNRVITRESLLKLFDKNDSMVAVLFSIILASLLAFSAYITQYSFSGFGRLWFWIVVASAHFSILKMPQPDSFAPSIEGGSTVAYTRAFYLCILNGVVILLSYAMGNWNPDTMLSDEGDNDLQAFEMYGFAVDEYKLCKSIRKFALALVLLNPVLYVLSLLPQLDTFVFYFLEQVNILVFGASGSPNFPSVIFEFVRSAFSCSVVAMICAEGVQHRAARSAFSAIAVALSYLNSRVINDPLALWPTFKQLTNAGHRLTFWLRNHGPNAYNEPASDYDALCSAYPPLRFLTDLIFMTLFSGLTFGLDITGIFGLLSERIPALALTFGFLFGLIFDVALPRVRHAFPFSIFQAPLLANVSTRDQERPPVMWFEKMLAWSRSIQTIVIYPVILLGYMSTNVLPIAAKAGTSWGVVITTVCAMRALRSTFTDVSRNHLFLLFTVSYFSLDANATAEAFLINYFFGSIFMLKIDELVTKLNYVLVYIAPWNLSWGSTFHAVAAPFTLPHLAFFLTQNLYSALISSPIYPVLGSVFFLSSYPRPTRFWESRRTAVVWNDLSNMPLHTSLALNHTPDNPDAAFYYHLYFTLQETLNRDREAGRLGSVHTGDFYLITNDTLTALIHIVAIGNGYTSFQLRGLELQGTLCQEHELAAIQRSDYSLERNCCLPKPLCKLPPLLSFRDSSSFRWNTWRVVNKTLCLNTYSICLLPAASMFNLFSLRQVLVKMFVHATIFYFIDSPSLERWLHTTEFVSVAESIGGNFIESDLLFCRQIDLDYDVTLQGINLMSFFRIYGNFIAHCLDKRRRPLLERIDIGMDSLLVRLCFVLSILARRVLVLNRACAFNTTMFLQRYHSLLGGDFRITAPQDEWVLADVSVLDTVVTKALRISLRLHQAHVASEGIDNDSALFEALCKYETELVVCREDSPEWREAITRKPAVPQLLSLRRQRDTASGSDIFFVVFLTLHNQHFTLTRLNRECVRGCWAGQQQELVYMGNTNSERGSIQQLTTVLRNIINQACDPPIGYPVFISSIATSYSSFWRDVAADMKLPHFVRRALGWAMEGTNEPLPGDVADDDANTSTDDDNAVEMEPSTSAAAAAAVRPAKSPAV